MEILNLQQFLVVWGWCGVWWVVVVSLPEILRAYLSVVVVKKKLSYFNSDPGDIRLFDPIPSPPTTTVRSREVVDSLLKK